MLHRCQQACRLQPPTVAARNRPPTDRPAGSQPPPPAPRPSAQVEQKQHPELAGRPVGVVQYNPNGDLQTFTAEQNRVRADGEAGFQGLIAVR